MRRLVKALLPAVALGVCLAGVGCVDVRVKEVAPIHMTLDVNIRVQKEVDKTFDYLYSGDPGAAPAPPTQPATGM